MKTMRQLMEALKLVEDDETSGTGGDAGGGDAGGGDAGGGDAGGGESGADRLNRERRARKVATAGNSWLASINGLLADGPTGKWITVPNMEVGLPRGHQSTALGNSDHTMNVLYHMEDGCEFYLTCSGASWTLVGKFEEEPWPTNDQMIEYIHGIQDIDDPKIDPNSSVRVQHFHPSREVTNTKIAESANNFVRYYLYKAKKRSYDRPKPVDAGPKPATSAGPLGSGLRNALGDNVASLLQSRRNSKRNAPENDQDDGLEESIVFPLLEKGSVFLGPDDTYYDKHSQMTPTEKHRNRWKEYPASSSYAVPRPARPADPSPDQIADPNKKAEHDAAKAKYDSDWSGWYNDKRDHDRATFADHGRYNEVLDDIASILKFTRVNDFKSADAKYLTLHGHGGHDAFTKNASEKYGAPLGRSYLRSKYHYERSTPYADFVIYTLEGYNGQQHDFVLAAKPTGKSWENHAKVSYEGDPDAIHYYRIQVQNYDHAKMAEAYAREFKEFMIRFNTWAKTVK